MDDCIFCKIVSGQIPDYRIYEDDYVIALLDLHPCSKGHTIVIPKKHIADLGGVSAEEMSAVSAGVLNVYKLVSEKIKPDAMNIGINNGKAAGQAVPHIHWHIIPRWFNDGGGSMHSIVRNGDGIDVNEVFSLFK
jgi:histidine triad (HIT) family protein